MIRDEEIKRLINYIKGIGLKISFSSKDQGVAALWYLDNSEIVICRNNNKTKISTVLSLIHELGHAMHNIHEKSRKIDTKVEKALDHVNEAQELNLDSKKRQRKIILDDEIAGTQYWHSIYKETNLKFPIWKMEAQMEFDIWQYEVYYETGRDPSVKEKKAKMKELREKYGS
ncbi:MAG TPA: hypothetical protein VIJ14_00685 [Rhabdochlamydiaceae bacterium]